MTLSPSFNSFECFSVGANNHQQGREAPKVEDRKVLGCRPSFLPKMKREAVSRLCRFGDVNSDR